MESLKEIPSLEPFEDDEGGDEEEDEDTDDVTYGETTPKQDVRGRVRTFFSCSYQWLRFFLIHAYRRYFVVPPDMWDISHYAQCDGCRWLLKRQGWEVEFKVSEERKVTEVTFRNKNRKKGRLQFYV